MFGNEEKSSISSIPSSLFVSNDNLALNVCPLSSKSLKKSIAYSLDNSSSLSSLNLSLIELMSPLEISFTIFIELLLSTPVLKTPLKIIDVLSSMLYSTPKVVKKL